MKTRSPQLSLPLEAALPPTRWHDGAEVVLFGQRLRLNLSTQAQDPILVEGSLHLPLPPAASPRQIQDAAESWLRREASQYIDAALFRLLPEEKIVWRFSFAAHGDWVMSRPDGGLRINWRLIEQPLAVLQTALASGLQQRTSRLEPAQAFALIAA